MGRADQVRRARAKNATAVCRPPGSWPVRVAVSEVPNNGALMIHYLQQGDWSLPRKPTKSELADIEARGRGPSQSHLASSPGRRRVRFGQQRVSTHVKRPAPPHRAAVEPGSARARLDVLSRQAGFSFKWEEDRVFEDGNALPSFKVTLYLLGTLDTARCPIWHSMLHGKLNEAKDFVAQQVLDYFEVSRLLQCLSYVLRVSNN